MNRDELAALHLSGTMHRSRIRRRPAASKGPMLGVGSWASLSAHVIGASIGPSDGGWIWG